MLFAPFLAGASLTALDKTKSGVFDVRPIAAGEILRRVVAKCLCATQKERASFSWKVVSTELRAR